MKHKPAIVCSYLAIALTGVVLVASLFVTGCAAPAVDRALFNIQTNYVPYIHVFTNTVVVTNTVEVVKQVERVATVTNTVSGAVASVTNVVNLTNVESRVTWQTNFVSATNLVAHDVIVTPKAAVSGSIGAVATAAGGPWGTFAAVAATGLLGIWARQRQKKINETLSDDLDTQTAAGGTLVQGIEVVRELMKTTPQGQAMEGKYVEWLKQHQQAAGVLTAVRDLIEASVDNKEARATAALIAPPRAVPASPSQS